MQDSVTCPRDQELQSFLNGGSSAISPTIADHLEGCNLCQQRLEKLLASCENPIVVSSDELERAQTAQVEAEKLVSIDLDDVIPVGHPWGEIENIELLRCIGRGGMGAVFEANQREPIERRVAVKFMRNDRWNPELAERFHHELQLLASIEHPGVARLYDAGQLPSGDPFLVMEFIDGTPITNFCDHREFGIRERLELFIKVCDAVQYLHQRQIIHRDLKPANILVVDGQTGAFPKLIDFGLARQLHLPSQTREHETRVGQPIGTLRYMSPEQAGFSSDMKTAVDSRTDIYSLGILLFELLVGDTPITAEEARTSSFLDVLMQIRNQTPTSLSQRLKAASSSEPDTNKGPDTTKGVAQRKVLKEASRELDWVVVRALQREPSERYASVDALAQDLKNYLDNRPLTARPPSVFYQATKFCQRHSRFVTAIAVFLLTIVLGTAGTTIGFIRARQAAIKANRLADEERAMRRVAESRLTNLNNAARILHGVFEQLNPEIASRGGDGALRAELGRGLERAAVEMLSDDAAEGADTLVLKLSLAKALQNLERTDAALPLIKQVLEQSQAGGISVEDRIALLATLGAAHRAAHQFEDSHSAFEQAHDLAVSHFEESHRLALAGKYYLSIIEADKGCFLESRTTAQVVVDGSEIEDPEFVNMHVLALGQVAFANAQLRDFEAAVSDYARVLKHWERQLPESHPIVLEARSNLALCLAKSGEKSRAREMLADILEKTREQYPEDSRRVTQAQKNLRSVQQTP